MSDVLDELDIVETAICSRRKDVLNTSLYRSTSNEYTMSQTDSYIFKPFVSV